jgi:hypothetical protein
MTRGAGDGKLSRLDCAEDEDGIHTRHEEHERGGDELECRRA